jgi:hypothetical protein
MNDILDSQSDPSAGDSSGGWLSFLDTAGSVAGKVLGALNGGDKKTTATPAKSTMPAWLPWAIGGGVVLLVLGFVFTRK